MTVSWLILTNHIMVQLVIQCILHSVKEMIRKVIYLLCSHLTFAVD